MFVGQTLKRLSDLRTLPVLRCLPMAFQMISEEVLVVSRSIAYDRCWRNIKESHSRATFGECSSTGKKLYSEQ